MSKLKIVDWYCHQGHQYEFFKTGHDFNLCGIRGDVPVWNEKHRPLNSNVKLVSEKDVLRTKYDIVMVRSPLNMRRYLPFIRNGAVPVAVVQTTSHYGMLSQVKNVVWNSKDVMNLCHKHYPGKKHFNIVHGFDPDEFTDLGLEDNGRILTVANVFRKRGNIMGYPLWQDLNKSFGKCDIIGHGNVDISTKIKEAETFDELIKAYNKYAIFLNTTIQSAMPRSRAEAAMCGLPIVSTDNFDISRYFSTNGSIITNNVSEMKLGIKKLLESKDMRDEYGHHSREMAIKHFHINDYISKWNQVFNGL